MKLLNWFDKITGAERRVSGRVFALEDKLARPGYYCGDVWDFIRKVRGEWYTGKGAEK